MNAINSLKEFELLISDKISSDNEFHLDIHDTNFTFFVELVWIDSILRKDTHEGERISITFTNCKFKKFDCSNIPETNVIELNVVGGSIEELSTINSIFVCKFYINKQYGRNKDIINIGKFSISDSVFKENFKLHNAKINSFHIEDTDFEKHADFFKSSFQKGVLTENKGEDISQNDIGFKAINFRGLALFGDTIFKRKLIFKYVTFESYSHFRKAKLEKGLDLDYSNIQNEMNFFDVQQLGTKEAKKNTSQETYRIIKHNFEKIGNKIEANKYLALELEQKKITLEIKKPREWLDYLVFKTHWMSSEFGTNWLKPILFISLTSLMTICFLHYSLIIEVIFNPSVFKFKYVFEAVNDFFKYMYILNKSKELTSSAAILLLNKALLSYFYYQFLISIRKNTK